MGFASAESAVGPALHVDDLDAAAYIREAKLSACAYIFRGWGMFPLIRKAVMRKGGFQHAVINVADFPVMVW